MGLWCWSRAGMGQLWGGSYLTEPTLGHLRLILAKCFLGELIQRPTGKWSFPKRGLPSFRSSGNMVPALSAPAGGSSMTNRQQHSHTHRNLMCNHTMTYISSHTVTHTRMIICTWTHIGNHAAIYVHRDTWMKSQNDTLYQSYTYAMIGTYMHSDTYAIT